MLFDQNESAAGHLVIWVTAAEITTDRSTDTSKIQTSWSVEVTTNRLGHYIYKHFTAQQ